ncbi:MAG: hypothetical protein MZV64_03185 [Ignavibacteriales bacterium]|nr:hypothetical protein [Ignavibacteriales bacterium]
MAMLPLNNVFQNSWLGVLNKHGFTRHRYRVLEKCYICCEKKNPEFIFLGEAYWDLEWNLQQLGFDFTYDKRLTDRLAANDLIGVRAHLQAEKSFQLKSAKVF